MSPSFRIRAAAWAGRFYPAEPEVLRRDINTYLAEAKAPEGPPPKAVIAPHAGYIYSGPVAASAFVHWRGIRDQVTRVVLVGPAHYAGFAGLAATAADAFETPLGQVPVDGEAVAGLRSLPQVRVHEEAHRPEHCLEVELPFLQVVLDRFSIVPLLAGDTSDEEICQVLESLWDGAETRVVVSSDLSHYHDYRTAQTFDAATARAIEALQGAELDSRNACGCQPVRGLLRVAAQRGLRAAAVDLRNSGDTAGPRDRVVGYGAFVFRG
jgi:hypothetical protein